METQHIWTNLSDRLRDFVARRVDNDADVEDILQDVFLRVHARRNTLADERKLTSWVYQVTRNAVVDHYRGRRPLTLLSDSLAAPEAPPDDMVQELLPGLGSMLAQLSAADREALLLTEVEGLTQQEMADRLNLSLSGAKSRAQRARKKLKHAFIDCCDIELDRRGGVAAYQPGCDACRQE
ncbi:MAG: RNA polymerase sigma factor SigZ [Chloroflexota bacterium]|nr:RNA polymerase sigma factor SigZ [Chloroflexota bacterium]